MGQVVSVSNRGLAVKCGRWSMYSTEDYLLTLKGGLGTQLGAICQI